MGYLDRCGTNELWVMSYELWVMGWGVSVSVSVGVGVGVSGSGSEGVLGKL